MSEIQQIQSNQDRVLPLKRSPYAFSRQTPKILPDRPEPPHLERSEWRRLLPNRAGRVTKDEAAEDAGSGAREVPPNSVRFGSASRWIQRHDEPLIRSHDGRAEPSLLEEQGWRGLGPQHWNASQAVLAEHALSRGEGELSDQGALVFKTGTYTGRSPKDKFIVREPSSEAEIDWGEVNFPFDPDRFDAAPSSRARALRGA